MAIHKPSPLDSILDAVLTVSPNKQYRGILVPTTPAQTEPRKYNLQTIIMCDRNATTYTTGRHAMFYSVQTS